MALSGSFWGGNADPAQATGGVATASPAATRAAVSVKGPQSGIGKFLVDNAPAIGGTIAGVAALPLNLLDAVTGVGGTALDAGAAGLGSAAGEQVKQSIQGNGGSGAKQAGQDVIQGAEGAGGQLAGIGIGKGLTKLGSTIVKPVVQAATDKAAQDALQAGVDKTAPFANVPTAIRNGSSPGTGLKSIQQFLSNLGMGTDPASMHAAANVATGANGAVSGTVRQILAGVGNIPTGDFETPVKEAIGKEAGTLGQLSNPHGAASNMLQEVRNTIGANLYDNQGNITNSADANKVFDAIQALGAKADAKPAGEMGQAQANVLNAAKQSLERSLYNNGGANDAVSAFKLAPEDEAAIRGEISKTGGSTLLSDHLINGINNAKSVQDLRSMQAPFVNAGNLANAADKAGEGVIAKMPSSSSTAPVASGTGGLLSKVAGQAVPMGALAAAIPTHGASLLAIPAAKLAAKVADSAPVRTAAGAALSAGGKAIAGEAPSVGGLFGRFATQSAAHALPGGAAAPTTSAPVATSSAGGATLPDSVGTSGASTMGQPTSNYSEANMIADMERDPKNATYYQNLYKAVNPNGDLSTNQKNEAAGAQKALSQLGDYANQLTAAGGGKGPVGGYLENLLGEFGVGAGNQAAHALSSQRTDVASAVAASLSPRGTAQASITKMIADSLPTIGDTKAVAEDKMNQLTQRIKDGYYTSLQSITDPTTVTSAAPANQ